MEHPASHVESHWRTQLRNHIIQASSLLEILLSGLVLIGLLLSAVPLIRWMPGLLIDGNEVEIRTFLERSLDIVIGIEFIKMLAKHSPGSSLEVLLYAIARHLVVGHDSALENLLSVGAIALIFIVRKYFFVPAFGAHLPDGHLAPSTGCTPNRKQNRARTTNNLTKRKTGGAAQHCVQAPPVSLFDFTVCRGGQNGIPCRRGCAGCWSDAYR
jgi:phosphate starvation-inducible membrane PsiE